MRICFVGNVSQDRNVMEGQVQELAGGGVFHGGITAARLGAEVTVVTHAAADSAPAWGAINASGARLVLLERAHTTTIENRYVSDDPDLRVSRCMARGASFTVDDLRHVDGEVVHVNPMIVGEVPLWLLPHLRERAPVLSWDAQGLLRAVAAGGELRHEVSEATRRALPSLDALKVDVSEARSLTGESDPRAAARALHRMGATLVLMTHRGGLLASDGRQVAEAAFGPATMSGRTGRGDTCTAAFLTARFGAGLSLAEATRVAAQVTSHKMRRPGPYAGGVDLGLSPDEVSARCV